MAHSNCQQKLVEIWYTGIRKFTKMNQFVFLLIIFAFIPTIPFLSVLYMVMPNSKVNNHYTVLIFLIICLKFDYDSILNKDTAL